MEKRDDKRVTDGQHCQNRGLCNREGLMDGFVFTARGKEERLLCHKAIWGVCDVIDLTGPMSPEERHSDGWIPLTDGWIKREECTEVTNRWRVSNHSHSCNIWRKMWGRMGKSSPQNSTFMLL